MRAASSEHCGVEFQLALVAHLTADAFRRTFPVEFDEMDPLAAAEPSVGSVIELKSGRNAAVTYGRETGTLNVEVPSTEDGPTILLELLIEAPLELSAIQWIRPALVAPLKKTQTVEKLKERIADLTGRAIRGDVQKRFNRIVQTLGALDAPRG